VNDFRIVGRQFPRDADLPQLAVLPEQPAIEDPTSAHEPCAIVITKIGRMNDRRMGRQIFRRRHDHAPAAQQGAPDRSPIARFIKKYSDINLFLDDIDSGVVQDQFDADVRIAD
jgi:hypothetical protein